MEQQQQQQQRVAARTRSLAQNSLPGMLRTQLQLRRRGAKARRKGQAEAGWPYGVELVCLTESHPNLLEASNLSGRLSRRIHHVHAISTTNPGFILPHHNHVH